MTGEVEGEGPDQVLSGSKPTASGRDRLGQWPDIARLWREVGSPLRPVKADLDLYAAAAGGWSPAKGDRARGTAAPRVLLMGVTPELHGLAWPAGTDFQAVDRTQEMIDYVWPGPTESAHCRDWLELGFPRESRDIVLCDGGFTILAYPSMHQSVVRSLREIVSPGGRVILRLYVPKITRETPAHIMQDLVAGRVRDLNALKLRLCAAMSQGPNRSVELGNVWLEIHRILPDFENVTMGLGWTRDHVQLIHLYRDSKTRYYYPTCDDVREVFTRDAGGFNFLQVATPSYELGSQCPVIAFERCGP